MYMYAQRFDEAYPEIETAIAIMPDNPEAHIALSRWYVLSGDYVKGEEAARKVLELDPMRATAYSVLAYSLYNQNEADAAIEAGLKGLEIIDKDVSLLAPDKYPVRKDLYYIIANAYLLKGDNQNNRKYAEMGNEI